MRIISRLHKLARRAAAPIILPLLGQLGRSVPHRSGAKRALIIPPARFGSVGDAAMISVARDQLRARGFAADIMLPPGWSILRDADGWLDDAGYFYGERLSPWFDIVRRLPRYEHVLLIGADVLDGAYMPRSIRRRISVLHEQASHGRAARVLGSSFSDRHDPLTLAALRRLPAAVQIFARDPVSHDRMNQALGRDIELTADTAFLLSTSPDGETAKQAARWVETRRSAGDLVVGLNVNALQEARYPGFVAAHIPLLLDLLGDGISIMLVPHDTRAATSDVNVLRQLLEQLPASVRPKLFELDPADPRETKASLALLDLVISSRMHAAILAMGSEVPALCFSYQGKFEGLYSLLGLADADLLHEPESLMRSPRQVAEAVRSALANRRELQSRLHESLPEVRELAERNFAGIE